jgi:hypothetical protein
MTLPHEKLAESLKILKDFQDQGITAIRSKSLSRTHRERLLKNGFLQEVIKGWYLLVSPNTVAGESTVWYSSFWSFISKYLNERFGNDWCLSPEQSLLFHVGNLTVPDQLIVHALKARNKITQFPHHTSLLDIRARVPEPENVTVKNNLRLFTVPCGLIHCTSRFFRQHPADARAVLSMISDLSEILSLLLENGRTTIAGRLAGGFRSINQHTFADEIIKTMQAAGYDSREKDPFESATQIIIPQQEHPYASRLRFMWQQMRDSVLKHFSPPSGHFNNVDSFLKKADQSYVTDAYHSLSIEGYQVNEALIEKVQSGNWHPDENKNDKEQFNALAARGYWQAYQAVRESIRKVFSGHSPGLVCRKDHGIWYREMFAPSVNAGILKPSDLAGYRNTPVYLRRSMHVPPSYEAVRSCMPEFFDLLDDEKEPSVRVVLGHFFFVFIHPYPDGNGRIGRFLMNIMLAAGGYPWTVIPLDRRDLYIDALEKGSVEQDIVPFTHFLNGLVGCNPIQ